MAIGFVKVYTREGIPVFKESYETLSGGLALDMSNLTAGEEVPAGALVIIDEDTRLGKIVGTAKVYEAAASSTTVKIEKGSRLKAGDVLDGVAINSIDTTNADYDVLTMASAVDAALGDILENVPTSGKDTGLLLYGVIASVNESISVVIRGTALVRRIPPIDKAQVSDAIILSNSK